MENWQEIVDTIVRGVRVVGALVCAGWYAYHRMKLKLAGQEKSAWKCTETYGFIAAEIALLKDEVARAFLDA